MPPSSHACFDVCGRWCRRCVQQQVLMGDWASKRLLGNGSASFLLGPAAVRGCNRRVGACGCESGCVNQAGCVNQVGWAPLAKSQGERPLMGVGVLGDGHTRVRRSSCSIVSEETEHSV